MLIEIVKAAQNLKTSDCRKTL